LSHITFTADAVLAVLTGFQLFLVRTASQVAGRCLQFAAVISFLLLLT